MYQQDKPASATRPSHLLIDWQLVFGECGRCQISLLEFVEDMRRPLWQLASADGLENSHFQNERLENSHFQNERLENSHFQNERT